TTSRTWTVDVTPPTVGITTEPPASSNTASPTFGFTGADNLTPAGSLQFQVSLDNPNDSGFGPIAGTTYVAPNLGDGSHTVRVRAIDLAGNVSGVQSYAWTVDTTP